ncbi:hypothetical protein IEQ34_015563 [Dendrobium chrysotoxum]|uniref:Uncharacterized protein n=1 Tax=Dendrobium chrysotoxum TaxID=161865 RepID=A0AAV7GGH8_DENCH|nr:hypothetical protein IEQ34_015563 [Dendrobium chrysotoxum]
MIIFPSDFNRSISGKSACLADTVLMIPSITSICSASLLTRKASAPNNLMASSFFQGEVLMTVTFIRKALPNLTATWPSPPRPTTPMCFPGWLSSKFFMGVYTVIPAQSNGAPLSKGKFLGNFTTKCSSTTIIERSMAQYRALLTPYLLYHPWCPLQPIKESFSSRCAYNSDLHSKSLAKFDCNMAKSSKAYNTKVLSRLIETEGLHGIVNCYTCTQQWRALVHRQALRELHHKMLPNNNQI